MTKKERTGRQIIRETLRIAWLVQAGAYTLMQRLNERHLRWAWRERPLFW